MSKLNARDLPPDDRAPALSRQAGFRPNGREPELSGIREYLFSPLIVHVEDDEAIRTLLRVILGDYGGYRVKSFSHGKDGFDFCQQTPPDILITDINHPGIDGLTLCHLMRNNEALSSVALMLLTAYQSRQIDQQAHVLDATLVTKPCDALVLIEIVHDLTRQQGLEVPASRAQVRHRSA